MDWKELGKGAVITLLIGGGAYTLSQGDIAKNFAQDTGLTQAQAEQYVNSVTEDQMSPFDEVGSDLVDNGQDLLDTADEIDCVNYEYEWESTTLSCQKGRSQLYKVGRDYVSLGQAYIRLSADSASRNDISATIPLIDQLNLDFDLEIVGAMLDWQTIDEERKTNSYNKALLKTALESE